MLDQRGICASSGSACTSGSLEPSHVLSALDVLGSDLQAALRVTLGRSTTPADVEFIVAQVVTVVQLLRQA